MKRRILPICFLAIFLLCTSASAIETRAAKVYSSLSFSGTTAICVLDVTAQKGEKVTGTIELWQGSTLIESWTESNTGYLSMEETQRVSKGKTYTLKAYGTIAGEPFTVTPTTKTCS